MVNYYEPLKSVEVLDRLGIDIHVDGPSLDEWKALARRSYIHGATFNPSLCRKLGVTDYEKFCRDVLELSQGKPVSLEVLADDFETMKKQAVKLSELAENVVVKIPIMNTQGRYTDGLVEDLVSAGVKVNVTAVVTREQVSLFDKPSRIPYIISVFAGRIADSGVDPVDMMRDCAEKLGGKPKLLWASTREVWNIFQAAEAGCQIITVPLPILAKAVQKSGSDVRHESLELVKQFNRDAVEAGFTL